LLSDLLSLAQIEARGVEELAKLELGQLARTAIEATTNPARVTLHCEGLVHVRGDRTWLLRALSNLLDNALVHSSNTEPITLTIAAEGAYVRVHVSNAGEVPKHVRKNIFRRFVTTRQDKGGSGLGLAIIRAVAEAHGGQAELLRAGPPEVEFCLRLPALKRPLTQPDQTEETKST
jgi:signal transduction histidine kinase